VTPLITVVIADRYPIVIDALDALFREADGFTVVARCGSAPEVRAAVAAHQPDVLVSDVWVNERDPLAFVRELRADRATTRIVLYSGRLNDELMLAAAYLRVEGVVPKTMPPASLLACVRAVHAGERWLKPHVPEVPAPRAGHTRSPETAMASLTPRELEIASLAARGRRSKDIARALDISPSTVRIHLHNVYVKLKLPGHVELTVFAREHGLLGGPSALLDGTVLATQSPEPVRREVGDVAVDDDRGPWSPDGGDVQPAVATPRRRGRTE
jgi:two-component system nitrate/nitrite response regulator NarL